MFLVTILFFFIGLSLILSLIRSLILSLIKAGGLHIIFRERVSLMIIIRDVNINIFVYLGHIQGIFKCIHVITFGGILLLYSVLKDVIVIIFILGGIDVLR